MKKIDLKREDDRDKVVANSILEGKCPFGYIIHGQSMSECPLGFPGCGCGDEFMLNPYLQTKVC